MNGSPVTIPAKVHHVAFHAVFGLGVHVVMHQHEHFAFGEAQPGVGVQVGFVGVVNRAGLFFDQGYQVQENFC